MRACLKDSPMHVCLCAGLLVCICASASVCIREWARALKVHLHVPLTMLHLCLCTCALVCVCVCVCARARACMRAPMCVSPFFLPSMLLFYTLPRSPPSSMHYTSSSLLHPCQMFRAPFPPALPFSLHVPLLNVPCTLLPSPFPSTHPALCAAVLHVPNDVHAAPRVGVQCAACAARLVLLL